MITRVRLLVGAAALLLALASGAGAAEAFSAHGSVEQVYATGLAPSAQASLLDRRGRKVATQRADSLGGVLFRDVRPGAGYRVRAAGQRSGALTVLSTRPAPPSTGVYDQKLPTRGYGYLTTRDGTRLAYFVHPPQDVANATGLQLPDLPSTGPVPTLIEYSGYGYADPAGPQSGIAILANLMGFAVVDVNMRGTGCSGGAFDFFEPLQSLDGYDIVETVARQSWVAHHKVGMMGISYGGISQLFTAQTQPPSLAAISPLSVIDATQTTLYPGGILNTGFAVDWAKERVHDAMPAGPSSGQAWSYKRVQGGDQTCKDNQVLHGEAADLIGKIRENDHYVPKVADPLAPVTFVNRIQVPVYMACQFTDEQTGGHCPTLAERFTGTRKKWFTFTNGTHVDSLDPETYNRWCDFLALYVAQQTPATMCAPNQGGAPVIYQEAMGISGVTMPPDPIQQQPTYATALDAFEKLASIRVLFDNGAGGSQPGQPKPGFEQSWPRFPIPGTTARSWYLADQGALADRPAATTGAESFAWNAHARPLTDFTGDTAAGDGGLWTATPPYKWTQSPAGSAVSYVTAPLTANTTVVGAGALEAWIRSSAPNVDLQATISEVRPDGKETFVQGGWLRGNERKLDARKSTLLAPVLSLRASDVSPLPRNRFVKATIPLYYEGHVYRAGSRIRITLTAPNGDQPIWSFGEAKPTGEATVAVAHSRRMPSRLVLPVVGGVDVPTGLPPCPGLRGEPCRDYEAYAEPDGEALMNDLFSLAGRTALVTGGSRGIGAAIATELVNAGARVIICARKADELEAATGRLSCEGIQADLSTLAGVEALVAAVSARTDRLDVLVNNAGATWGAPIDDFPESGWDKVMSLNVKAMHYLTSACLPLLRAAASDDGPARVINIGSIDGINAPVTENYAYSASKAAVHQLTRHLARRLAPENILVNAIAPGMFESRMTAFITSDPNVAGVANAMIPLKRMGRPEEIGGTAVYLASRAGGYTTGEVLVVDGGRTGAGRAD